MTFSDDLRRFAAKVEARQKDIFVGCVNGVRTSITEGSAVTTAPGQPVDTSALINSWKASFESEWVGLVASYNIGYAEAIEEGFVRAHERGPYTRTDGATVRRHGVVGHKLTFGDNGGGAHSVKLTRAGWQNLVDSVVKEVVRD